MTAKEFVPYRGLGEDFKSWYFDGETKHTFNLKQFSAQEIDDLFTKKVGEYEEYAKGVFTGKITEASRITRQNELAKYVFTTAFEGFTEDSWKKLWNDKKLGRGSIINSMKELWSFLAEMTNYTEAQLLQMRYSLMQ